LAEAFMARLARQLQELRMQMELRNIRSARNRVLQYLRLRARTHGRSIAVEGQLQDIAAEIGMTREALYRTLAALFVSMIRASVRVRSPWPSMSISRLSNARARARAAGFPRAGRKSQRRRRDKRADQPFAKIKELFKKIKRLS